MKVPGLLTVWPFERLPLITSRLSRTRSMFEVSGPGQEDHRQSARSKYMVIRNLLTSLFQLTLRIGIFRRNKESPGRRERRKRRLLQRPPSLRHLSLRLRKRKLSQLNPPRPRSQNHRPLRNQSRPRRKRNLLPNQKQNPRPSLLPSRTRNRKPRQLPPLNTTSGNPALSALIPIPST